MFQCKTIPLRIQLNNKSGNFFSDLGRVKIMLPQAQPTETLLATKE